MNSFLYFLCAVVLLVGLLLVGGYLGKENGNRSYSTTSDMAKLVRGQSSVDSDGSSGGCASCKWY